MTMKNILIVFAIALIFQVIGVAMFINNLNPTVSRVIMWVAIILNLTWIFLLVKTIIKKVGSSNSFNSKQFQHDNSK